MGRESEFNVAIERDVDDGLEWQSVEIGSQYFLTGLGETSSGDHLGYEGIASDSHSLGEGSGWGIIEGYH